MSATNLTIDKNKKPHSEVEKLMCSVLDEKLELKSWHIIMVTPHLISAFMFTPFILEECLVIFAVAQAELFARMMGFIMKLFCFIRGS